MSIKTEIVKKLSVAKLVGEVKGLLPDSRSDETPVTLGRVAGFARNVKEGQSVYGSWRCLMGDFVFEPVAGAKAGARFRSGQLFVPDVILDLVVPAVEQLGGNGQVEVAFAITARNDASSSVGYVYSCEFLVEPSENDPLTQLLNKALPAPNNSGKK